FFSCSAMLWHYKTTDRRRPNGIMPLTNFFVRTPQLNVSLHLTTNKAPQRRSIVGWIETDFFEWLFTVKAWNEFLPIFIGFLIKQFKENIATLQIKTIKARRLRIRLNHRDIRCCRRRSALASLRSCLLRPLVVCICPVAFIGVTKGGDSFLGNNLAQLTSILYRYRKMNIHFQFFWFGMSNIGS